MMALSVFILIMRSSSGSESSNSTNLCQSDEFTCGDSSCVPLEVIYHISYHRVYFSYIMQQTIMKIHDFEHNFQIKMPPLTQNGRWWPTTVEVGGQNCIVIMFKNTKGKSRL